MVRPTATHRFRVHQGKFLLDEEPFHILSGELHYARIPQEYWRHRLEMARAMGLNTVCLYLFWNYHEETPGRFDFSGEKDVRIFCDLAHELGLWVILRPGPYACAEWDFGGMPAYLLANPAMRLRCSYQGFTKPAVRYLKKVGKLLADRQITRGGPIILVQVENEYGAYGNDKAYLRILGDTLRESGFDVPLMRCDWANPEQLVPGHFDSDVVTVANFGSEAEKNITALAKFYPKSPRMSGEFWSGWFDSWGFPRNGMESEDGTLQFPSIKWMVENGVSFSLYMFHGGSTFGFNAGANWQEEKYNPTVTQYEYLAPLDMGGRPRAKFFMMRDLIAKTTGRPLPEPPALMPVLAIPEFALEQQAPLFTSRSEATTHVTPPTLESLSQVHGGLLYRTDLAGRCAGTAPLRILDVHDFAWVYFNGELVGTVDRRLGGDQAFPLTVPLTGPAILEILVEGMGHVNFGQGMADDVKGITRRVEHGRLTLFDWQVVPLPLDAVQLAALRFSRRALPHGRPAFYRGHFDCAAPGDTHLDLRGWGKGYVWVNGRNLGRYWSIGPQQTLYVPGVWLRRGRNEVVVLDFYNKSDSPRTLSGALEPILDQLNLPAPAGT